MMRGIDLALQWDVYKRYLEIEPNDDKTWNKLTDLLREHFFYEEALEAINKAIKINSREAKYYYNKALIFKGMGWNEGALLYSNYAIAYNKNYLDAWELRAVTQLSLNRLKDSQFSHNRLLELKTENANK